MTKNLVLCDKDGNKTGVADAVLAHKDHLLHKSVHGFVINEKNELLCRKISEENPLYPGYWSTGIGSHLQDSISVDEMIKLVCKQLGFSYDGLKLIGSIYVDDDYEHEYSPVYILKGNSIPELKSPIIEYKYFSVNEISCLKLKTTHLEESLELYLKSLN